MQLADAKMNWCSILFWSLLSTVAEVCRSQPPDEVVAQLWLNQYNADAEVVYYAAVEADWIYNTNLTDYNMGNSVSSARQKCERFIDSGGSWPRQRRVVAKTTAGRSQDSGRS